MNRLAPVLAISLAVFIACTAPAAAGPNGELQRSRDGGQHGSTASAAIPRPGPNGSRPAPVPPTRPAAVNKPSSPARPAAPSNSGHGANVSGPYDPSGVGEPSQNGKGSGGRGRPCAGCVGKADAKNPPGQMPGGSDHNAGYECDRNEGIGKTNPAHSGCGEQSTAGPLESPKATPAVAESLQAAALKLARNGTAPALVPAGEDATVLGAEQRGGPGALAADRGGSVIPAADHSLVGDSQLPKTGLALGLMALLGAAIGGTGLLLRRRTTTVPAGG